MLTRKKGYDPKKLASEARKQRQQAVGGTKVQALNQSIKNVEQSTASRGNFKPNSIERVARTKVPKKRERTSFSTMKAEASRNRDVMKRVLKD